MKSSDLRLDRLLRAAAEATSDQPNEMPFGFDTRVLARWRAGLNRDFVDVGRLLRRVVLLSLAVIALASAGAYQELRLSDDFGESLTDEYAIADSAIGSAFDQ
jgi:hypothetical protein